MTRHEYKTGWVMKSVIAVCVLAIFLSSAFAAEKPEIFVQLGHKYGVSAITFSPDGKYLASCSVDKTIKLWEVETGREVRTFRPKTAGTTSVDFSPDGKLLVVGAYGGFGDGISLWNVSDGRKVRTFQIGKIKEGTTLSVAFSPDGELIAAAVFDVAAIYATANSNNTDKSIVIQLIDVKTGQIVRTMEGHTSVISSIAFSSDGKYLVSGSGPYGDKREDNEDNSVRIWEVKSGREIQRFSVLSGVRHVAFSPDGNHVATIDENDNVILRNVKTGKKNITLYEDNVYLPGSFTKFSPDGRYIAVSHNAGILLWDVRARRVAKQLGNNVVLLSKSYFSSDHEKINIIGSGGLRSFDIHSGFLIGSNDLIFSISDRFYRFGDNEGYWIMDGQKDRKIARFPGKDFLKAFERVSGANNFSPDGRYMLKGDEKQNNLNIFDVRDNHLVAALENSPPYYKSDATAFSPDGNRVAAWYSDVDKRDIIALWDTATGKQVMKLYAYTLTAVFTANGRQIVSGGGDDIKLWDVETGKEMKTFRGHANAVSALSLSGDEKYLLSGDWDGKIKLWDFQTGAELKTFTGRAERELVSAVMFSADNRLILSTSSDDTTSLWNISTGKEIAQFINFTDGEWIVITPEGYYNASPNGDKYLNVRVGNNVYGIENYREAFYRPDLVKVALSGGSLRDYRALADVKQPPKVSIVQTPDKTTAEEFKLTLRLEEQGGGIGDVRLFLNDTAVVLDNGRGLKVVQKDEKGATYRSYTLKLSAGDNTIRAIAFNADNSMQSNDTTHQVTANFTSTRKPTLHALVIGIQEFKNPKLTLKYAVADANLFA